MITRAKDLADAVSVDSALPPHIHLKPLDSFSALEGDHIGADWYLGNPPPRRDNRQEHPYGLEYDQIRIELSSERPIWILSAFGPGRDTPAQLFGGYPREQSFEEMRLRHYELTAENRQQDALAEAQELYASAEDQIKIALRDIKGAVRFIREAEKQHPNRIDICKAQNDGVALVPGRNVPTDQPPAPSFAQPSGSTFGTPSQPGPPSNPFATAAASLVSGFAQQTGPAGAMSNPAIPAFGEPSAPVNAFAGAPVAANPFASAVSNQNPASVANAFAQASQNLSNQAPNNPFAAAAAVANPVGQSMTVGTNPFARPGENHVNQNAPPGFGVANQPTPSFGGQGFGGNAFGTTQPQPQTQTAGFQTAPTNGLSGFGAPSAGFAGAPSGGFGGSTTGNPQQQPQQQRQESHSAQRDGSGRLTAWNGQQVSYIDGNPCFKRRDGHWERIWFPDGNPNADRPEEIPLEFYDETTEKQYRFLKENGMFENCVIPELPPKREWTTWDL